MYTKTVKKEKVISKGISLDIFPSAGPYPNITGMRNLYWGKKAYILKVGIYAYKVTE